MEQLYEGPQKGAKKKSTTSQREVVLRKKHKYRDVAPAKIRGGHQPFCFRCP